MDPFFFVFVSKRVSSSRPLCWCVSHTISYRLFVPSTLWTGIKRRMNLSSILRCWICFQLLGMSWIVRVGIDNWCLFKPVVRICVREVGCGLLLRWMETVSKMYSMSIINRVHQETRSQAFIFQPCAKVRLVTILRQSGRQWWRKMEQSGMPMFQCQFVAGLYCRLFFFFFILTDWLG